MTKIRSHEETTWREASRRLRIAIKAIEKEYSSSGNEFPAAHVEGSGFRIAAAVKSLVPYAAEWVLAHPLAHLDQFGFLPSRFSGTGNEDFVRMEMRMARPKGRLP